MSDTVLDVRGPVSLAWLKPRLVSLFGSVAAAGTPTFEITSERQGVRLVPPPHAPRPYPPAQTTLPLYAASAVEPIAAAGVDLPASLAATTPALPESRSSVDVWQPAWLLGRRLIGPAIKATVGIGLIGAAGALAVTVLRNLPAADPAALAPPGSAWTEIVKPVRIYSLEAPEFAGRAATYTARRHVIGGGREDVLALGTLDGAAPAIRLRIFRRGTEPAADVPLFAALVHEAAQAGLAVGRSSLPDVLPTRFGRFEVADITLTRKDGAATPCGGFRLALDKPALSISGLACGRHVAPMSRQAMGCLIERLDVASARDDRALIDFFAATELRRNAACAGMRLGPDGLHAPWLDEKPGPQTPAELKSAAGKPARAVARDDKPVTSRKRLRRR